MKRALHRWRYRTSRVRRLRAAVYVGRCPACHRRDRWERVEPMDIGDVAYLKVRCSCGEVDLWLA